MNLPSVDDLFSTEEERQEAKLKKLYDIPLSEIDDFPDHPYRVLDDEDMQSLMDSISERGVITPAMVRQKRMADMRSFPVTDAKRLRETRLETLRARSWT